MSAFYYKPKGLSAARKLLLDRGLLDSELTQEEPLLFLHQRAGLFLLTSLQIEYVKASLNTKIYGIFDLL